MILPSGLSDFEGAWTLNRSIQDRQAGQVVKAEGHAFLRPDCDGLIYEEEVTVRVPGQAEMKGTRTYLWREDGDDVAIYFEDGRHFHALKLGQSQSRDHHDCPPDSYDAVYDFSGWPVWAVHWTVSGPRKAYEMKTEYRPR